MSSFRYPGGWSIESLLNYEYVVNRDLIEA